MSLRDFIAKQWIDVIEYTEPEPGILAYRYPMQDMEIQNGGGEGLDTWITPDATDEERRSAHEFSWQCLTSRSGCRTVCDLFPAAVEYANSATLEGKRELCAAPTARNSYW